MGYAWTFEDVEALTWPRWHALRKRLKIHPPTHWMLAGFLGYEPEAEKQYMTAEAAREFMARTGGRIDGVGRG